MLSTSTTKQNLVDTETLKVIQYKTGCLAQFAYLIKSGDDIAIIDPLRDVELYIEDAKAVGGSVKYIFQTHYHADFISGFLDLSQKTGAKIVYGPNSNPTFEAVVAENLQDFDLGSHTVKVYHTPGHTMESSTFVLETQGKPLIAFTGDTIFLGDVGRPDLAQKSDITTEDLAGFLFDSVQVLKKLPDDVIVAPAHGAGSACGKNIQAGDSSTIGDQKATNYALKLECKEEFVKTLCANISKPPAYFPRAVELNKQKDLESTCDVLKRSMKGLSADEVEAELKKERTYVFDIRCPDYDTAHIPGALQAPMAGMFAMWAAYIIDPEERIIIVAPEGKVEEVIIRLARTGITNVIGYLEGGFEAWTAAGKETESLDTIQYENHEDFVKNTEGHVVFDVRGKGELDSGVLDVENFMW